MIDQEIHDGDGDIIVQEHEKQVERAGEDATPHQHLAPSPAFAEQPAQYVEKEADAARHQQKPPGAIAGPAAIMGKPVGNIDVGGDIGGGVEQPYHGQQQQPAAHRAGRAEQLLDRDLLDLRGIDGVVLQQRLHGCGVARRFRCLDALDVQVTVGFLDPVAAKNHHDDRHDAEQEHGAPAETAERQIDAGSKEHADRPAALDD